MFAISLGSSPVSWPVSGTQCDVKMAALEVEVSVDTAEREAQGPLGNLRCASLSRLKRMFVKQYPPALLWIGVAIKPDILYQVIKPVALFLWSCNYCDAFPNSTRMNHFACDR